MKMLFWIIGVFSIFLSLAALEASLVSAFLFFLSAALAIPNLFMILMRVFPNIPTNFRWPAFSLIFIFAIFILYSEIDGKNLEVASTNSEETKVEHSEVIDEEEKDKDQDYRKDPVSYLMIESFTSGTEGFGTVLVIDFKIRNSASISYKDIVVSCSQLGASGSKIATREETIYDSIPANELKSFSKISMGFINQQTKSISCVITGAKIY